MCREAVCRNQVARAVECEDVCVETFFCGGVIHYALEDLCEDPRLSVWNSGRCRGRGIRDTADEQ